jgi:hypothetical protein
MSFSIQVQLERVYVSDECAHRKRRPIAVKAAAEAEQRRKRRQAPNGPKKLRGFDIRL